MNPLNEYYLRQPEPSRSIPLFLREFILKHDPQITETLSFGLPFFKFKGKMFCYFNYHKKFGKYYISFNKEKELMYAELVQEDRKLFKILLIDENEDLPVELISQIMEDLKKMLWQILKLAHYQINTLSIFTAQSVS